MTEGDGKLLTISQAARELGVHQNTLRSWVDKELVPAVILPSGYRRFTHEQITQIKQDLGLEAGASVGKAAA
jgi:DNA-binding transcriptional MerR regulator